MHCLFVGRDEIYAGFRQTVTPQRPAIELGQPERKPSRKPHQPETFRFFEKGFALLQAVFKNSCVQESIGTKMASNYHFMIIIL